MKKENKRLAQERRAKARKKQKVTKILTAVLGISIPILAFVALVMVIICFPFWENLGKDTGADSDTNIEADAGTGKLLTDKSLKIKNGDTVNIDYVGSIDGVEFEGGNTQGYGTELTIGSGMYIDDFEEQLIGAHPGDEVDVVVTFPEEYGNEELNGKEALFKVTVNGIYE